MAISVAWQTTATITANTSTALYTVPSTGNFGTYARDLVITNGGTANAYIAVGNIVTSAATATSFQVPAGGTVILTQCAVPTTAAVFGMAPAATSISIGFATNVAYV